MFDKSKSIFFEPTDVEKPDSQANVVADVPVESVETKQYRYRVEQSIMFKLEDQIVNHGVTRQEFLMTKHFQHGKLVEVETQLDQNVIEFNPKELEFAIVMLTEADKVKSSAKFSVDQGTGRIKEILNREEIADRWKNYESDFFDKFDFVQSSETLGILKNFYREVENQIADEKILLAEFDTKLFYHILFDQYLVKKEEPRAYKDYFLSSLFENEALELTIGQMILSESEDSFTLRRTGKLEADRLNMNNIITQYDAKYKPFVKYNFTDYSHQYQHDVVIDRNENIIVKSTVEKIETVKNNVQMLLSHDIKLVSL